LSGQGRAGGRGRAKGSGRQRKADDRLVVMTGLTRIKNCRPSILALSLLAAGLALWLAMALPGLLEAPQQGAAGSNGEARRLAMSLGLSDLALFTEARFTRHPSMADLHSAFQDHPASLDHFPSGSLVLPPRHDFRPGQMNADVMAIIHGMSGGGYR